MSRSIALSLMLAALAIPSYADAQASGDVVVVPPPPEGSASPPAVSATVTVVPAPPPSGPPVSSGVYVPPGGTPYATGGVYTPGGAYVPPASARSQLVIDWGLMGSGLGMFAGGWLVTFVSTIVWYDQTTACSSTGWFSYSCTHVGGPGGEGLAWSFLPLVGPWLMLTDSYLDTPGEIVFPVIAGLVQDVGFVLMMIAIATMHREVVTDTAVLRRREGDVRFSGGASAISASIGLDLAF